MTSSITYSPSAPECSYQDWTGLKPQRFKGGRFHDNHPIDELDYLLLGTSSTQSKQLGPSKRRLYQKPAKDQQFRPHIKINPHRNDSKVLFSAEQIPKLIKIKPSDKFKPENSIIYRNSQIGQSKLKSLQTGELKTGIYRNFYKSQFRS